MITLISPVNGANLSILTDVQKEFIRRDNTLREKPAVRDNSLAYPWLSSELRMSRNLSYPASVVFKWKTDDFLAPVRFELSVNEDFSIDTLPGKCATVGDIFISAEEPDVYCVRVNNLMSGTKYYWRVSAGNASAASTFTTAYGEIRPICMESINNVRDIGGRVNTEGKRIKQRLIYRGGEFEDFRIGSNGMDVAKRDLALKTDIDLRIESVDDGITSSPLGDGSKYVLAPLYAYGGTLNDLGRAQIRGILEILADENSYPAYFHCAAGADRTGTVGMYLDAILGMSDDDIMLNYNFTTLNKDFSRNWYHDEGMFDFISFLEETYPDASVSEMLMANLMLSGISEDTLQKLRDNLLE